MYKYLFLEVIVRGKHQLYCPHCSAKLTIRSSKQQHVLLRSIWLQCSNVMCGFTGAGIIEITHQISPSSQKNPDINLKKLKRRPDKYVKEIEPIPNLNLFPELEDS